MPAASLPSGKDVISRKPPEQRNMADITWSNSPARDTRLYGLDERPRDITAAASQPDQERHVERAKHCIEIHGRCHRERRWTQNKRRACGEIAGR